MKNALCWEVHVSRFCLAYHNWKAFAYTPWLPFNPYFQVIYIIYRWITLIFFFVYLMRSSLSGVGALYLQYLTNWGFMSLVLYLLWSAVCVTYTYIRVLLLKWNTQPVYTTENKLSKPPGCCSCQTDSISWYQKVHWILFTLSSEIAMGICLLYWSLVYTPEEGLADINVVLHAANAVFSYIDLWVIGIPVRLYHFYIIMIFGATYFTFSGIHYAALVVPNITGPIYPGVLDYGNDPVSSTVIGVVTLFVGLPLLHLFFYGSYLLRQGLIYVTKEKLLKTMLYQRNNIHNHDEYDQIILA